LSQLPTLAVAKKGRHNSLSFTIVAKSFLPLSFYQRISNLPFLRQAKNRWA